MVCVLVCASVTVNFVLARAFIIKLVGKVVRERVILSDPSFTSLSQEKVSLIGAVRLAGRTTSIISACLLPSILAGSKTQL